MKKRKQTENIEKPTKCEKELLKIQVLNTRMHHENQNKLIVFGRKFQENLTEELIAIKEKDDRIEYLKSLLAKINIDNDLLEGMNKIDTQINLNIKTERIEHLLANYKGIPEFKNASKDCFHLEGNNINETFIKNTYEHLITSGLISRETTESAFKSIFNNKVNNKQVNWIGDINQLYYFIIILVKLPNINVTKKWILTCECFRLKGEKMKNGRFHGQKKPKIGPRTEVIEIIFKN